MNMRAIDSAAENHRRRHAVLQGDRLLERHDQLPDDIVSESGNGGSFWRVCARLSALDYAILFTAVFYLSILILGIRLASS